jgi:hypothetical protein
MNRNDRSVWLYVLGGSAIGGTVGYLLGSGSGQKIRNTLRHPDELPNSIEDARKFIETKARMVTDQVNNILQKAKYGIEEGRRTYHEAGQRLHSRVHDFHGKATENVSRTSVTIEQELIHPLCDVGAAYRGIERGIKTVLGKLRSTDRMAAD